MCSSTLHPFVLTPYRKPQVVESIDNFDFNLIHSSARVAVENTIGVLKGRWRFLKNILIELNRPDDIVRINEAISVCVILHNYLIITPFFDVSDETSEQCSRRYGSSKRQFG